MYYFSSLQEREGDLVGMSGSMADVLVMAVIQLLVISGDSMFGGGISLSHPGTVPNMCLI